MRKYNLSKKETQFNVNTSVEGETIEEKMRKLTTEKETPPQMFETIYTEKKDGVLAGCDIRTDRFEIAREMAEKIEKSEANKRAKARDTLKPAEPQDEAEA